LPRWGLSLTHYQQGGQMMRSYHHGRFRQQATFLRRQFLQEGELPFTDVLSDGTVAQALAAVKVVPSVPT
jgi:hypothetical protein